LSARPPAAPGKLTPNAASCPLAARAWVSADAPELGDKAAVFLH